MRKSLIARAVRARERVQAAAVEARATAARRRDGAAADARRRPPRSTARRRSAADRAAAACGRRAPGRSDRASRGAVSGRQHAQAAAHAEVQDQVAVAAVEEQVLRAPRHARARCVRRGGAPRAGTRQRRRGSRTVTAEILRPAICGAMPRRVTSTSGSSGTGTIACAGHQIYLHSTRDVRRDSPAFPPARPAVRRGRCVRAAAARRRRR